MSPPPAIASAAGPRPEREAEREHVGVGPDAGEPEQVPRPAADVAGLDDRVGDAWRVGSAAGRRRRCRTGPRRRSGRRRARRLGAGSRLHRAVAFIAAPCPARGARRRQDGIGQPSYATLSADVSQMAAPSRARHASPASGAHDLAHLAAAHDQQRRRPGDRRAAPAASPSSAPRSWPIRTRTRATRKESPRARWPGWCWRTAPRSGPR